MKRVKAACILQTLVFSQRPELSLPRDEALELNLAEVQRYKESLIRTKTRHIITDEIVQDNGSVLVRVKKQYNETADVGEYFA